MNRRRSLPWIHRWSRPLIGAISVVGAILTTYITVVKMFGGEVACSSAASGGSGCNNVLDSTYAEVFGLPLSLFGFLGYVAMAVFALAPLLVNRETQRTLKKNLEDWTWLLLLAGSTAMTIFSGYLMYLLAFEIKTVCYYCIASAILSLSLFIITIVGRSWEDFGQILFIGIVVAIITLVGTFAVYANNAETSTAPLTVDGKIAIERPTTEPKAPHGWKITSVSGPSEIALAKHLTSIGAKEYGAFWCPHCFEQKQLFGEEAFQEVKYIECAPEGKNPQIEACQASGIKGFPSWEIKGKIYPGTQSLEDLAELSEYTGPKDFKYTLKRAK